MFDSAEDVNQAPITNVLVRLTGPSRANVKTYYLTTVHMETAKSNTAMYKRISDLAIKEWIGYEKMAGIVTDNTGNVKKAREEMMNEHGRLVASQDQAHVADKLMQDIGTISWISDVIKAVSGIAVHYRRFRKVKVRITQKIKERNQQVRRAPVVDGHEASRQRLSVGDRRESNTERPQEDPSQQSPTAEAEVPSSLAAGRTDLEIQNEQMLNHLLHSSTYPDEPCLIDLAAEGYHALQQEVDEHDEDEAEAEGSDPSAATNEPETSLPVASESLPESSSSGGMFTPQATGFSRIIKKMSIVRFASAEKLLGEFISLRSILKELVVEEGFDELYSFRKESERAERQAVFIDPILNEELFHRVIQAQAILCCCRSYLRTFDKETALSSEVYEATRILEKMLSELPLRNFPEPREANKEYLLRVFNNRKEGPFPGMKQVRITLLSDLHYAAALLDPYRTPRGRTNLVRAYSALRRHLAQYFQGADIETLGRTMEEFIDEVVERYNDVRASWIDRNIMRVPEDSASGKTAAQAKRSMQNPTTFWTDGKIRFPDDPFQRKALEELIEFACRTLSVSPTATASERSFSISGRIYNHQPMRSLRSSLSGEKVEKLLFAQWNGRVIRTSSKRDMFDMEKHAESQTYPVQALRNYRKLIVRTFRRGFQGRGGSVGAAAGAQAAAQAALRAASGVQRRQHEHSDTQELRSLTTSTARASRGRRGRGRSSKPSSSRQLRSATNDRTNTIVQPIPAVPLSTARRTAPPFPQTPPPPEEPPPNTMQRPNRAVQLNTGPNLSQGPLTSLRIPTNQPYVTQCLPALASSQWQSALATSVAPDQPQMIDVPNRQQWIPTSAMNTTVLPPQTAYVIQQPQTTQQLTNNFTGQLLYGANPQSLGAQIQSAPVTNEQIALGMFWNAVNLMRESQSRGQFASPSEQVNISPSAIDINATLQRPDAALSMAPGGTAHTDQQVLRGSHITQTGSHTDITINRGTTRGRSPQQHGSGQKDVAKKRRRRTHE